ncbi:MAG: response regulator transcription factor [Candidatus Rokubacteria bacterium]|nr:response regulator transcription factor [Candidatus Rokubacteria bacterium]
MANPVNRKPRVLVVDDHPMVREGIRSLLSGEVGAWAEAGTGEEAIKKLAEVKPELVLLDVKLPDLDGLTVLRRIKAISPTTSVLMVTMHDNPGYVRQALKLGAAGYVLKGITRRELLAAVRAVCEGESVIEPSLLRQLLEEVTIDSGAQTASGSTTESLTRVERDVLALLTQGLTNREIAQQLRWSLGTAKKYVQRILEKLQVADRTQAAVEAVRRGLIG